MLVLTRKLMETLYIGDNIRITVVRLENGQVRLGIDAPREVPVVRAELVPERQAADAPHPAAVQPGPTSPRPAPLSLRRSPSVAGGTGSRRRGRSR